MDRRRLSAIAHARHPVAAPLADESVAHLLAVALPASGTVLDLGCGGGAWLVAAQAVHPGLRLAGVDTDPLALARASAALGPAASLVEADAATFPPGEPADVVLCVGASHAFGGLAATLTGAGRHAAPGGALVVGDGFWERPPHEGTLAAGFEVDDHRPLPDVVDLVVDAGWEIEAAHVSSAEEWDAYEWAWVGTATAWALAHPDDPDAADVLAGAREHRHHWLRGWRHTLGFVTFVLRRAPVA